MNRDVVVAGGGVAGLLTAWRLAQHGDRVTVIEARERLGGQVCTTEFAGMPVDIGAEAAFLLAPQVAALVRELGLMESVVGARTGTTWLPGPRGLRTLPEGVGPTGPTKILPVLRAKVLTLPALARAGLEPLLARRTRAAAQDDISVGQFVSSRFGREVADRFVDPLLGSLHSGDINRLSLQSVAPQLLPTARSGRSLLMPGKRAGGPKRPAAATRTGPRPPSFASWPRGMRTLVDALGAAARAAGVEIRTGVAVSRLAVGEGHWEVHLAERQDSPLTADLVILALPAARAATLLDATSPQASVLLDSLPTASVANVLAAFRREDIAASRVLGGNGMLLSSDAGRRLKAATFLSRKWPQLDQPGSPFLVRLSLGRYGTDLAERLSDTELTEIALRDLGEITGMWGQPLETKVVRWLHTMPQLLVGHRATMSEIDDDLAATAGRAGLTAPRLVGAAYDGTGLGAVIASAEKLATSLNEQKEPA